TRSSKSGSGEGMLEMCLLMSATALRL
ncbi:hypothetical protein AB1N83_013704, partial [Pleurotus pulmonarius]